MRTKELGTDVTQVIGDGTVIQVAIRVGRDVGTEKGEGGRFGSRIPLSSGLLKIADRRLTDAKAKAC